MNVAFTSGDAQTIERFVPYDVSLRALHQQCPERFPFLLESTATGTQLGKFDILFACPGESLALDTLQSMSGPGSGGDVDFLHGLDNWWSACQTATSDSQLPFHGGWFLYLGYELAAQIEPRLSLRTDPDFPIAFAVRCPAALIHDHASGKIVAICESESADQLDSIIEDARAATALSAEELSAVVISTNEEESSHFLAAVSKAKEFIADGDIYQANLSRAWTVDVDDNVSPGAVYAKLCDANPAPFAGIARWGDSSIISSSPERLVTVRGRDISTRPIAGTRPRGENSAVDAALSDELFGHPKERAEHVMLIDLERNDLGRVCEPGTVHVDEYMILESYAHVHHIVSNVRGRLKRDVSPGGAIRAVFPGGTITGCPKVRCMEIISELERTPRGAYTGSFGYLNRDGSLDLNILIRTMVMRGNSIQLKAGSGIVADSEPEAELAETRAKAKGLLMALN